MKKLLSALCGLLLVSFGGHSLAQSGELLKRPSVEETILNKLELARPDLQYNRPKPSPFPGLYQVQIPNGPILYITADGEKFIIGDSYTVGNPGEGFDPLEDPEIIEARKKALLTLDAKQSIVFKPQTKTKAVVYVFTDVDCGYCRKLHGEMKSYNDLGIEIRYLAFPRAGIPSPAADKLVSAWCAKDRQAAISKLKKLENIPNATCDNPVAAHFELGGRLGVNATPALLLPNGALVLGALPPADLAKKLGI
jgi:thiol:disulfide interchange protein DsbC